MKKKIADGQKREEQDKEIVKNLLGSEKRCYRTISLSLIIEAVGNLFREELRLQKVKSKKKGSEIRKTGKEVIL